MGFHTRSNDLLLLHPLIAGEIYLSNLKTLRTVSIAVSIKRRPKQGLEEHETYKEERHPVWIDITGGSPFLLDESSHTRKIIDKDTTEDFRVPRNNIEGPY